MADNSLAGNDDSEANNLPDNTMAIDPAFINMPTQQLLSVKSAPIPSPPNPSNTSSPTIISPPAKRFVRPRATTDQEKQSRAEERKLANRAAAKISRERQKQAMQQAQRENDLLKEENQSLLARLASLEQRMQVLETRRSGVGSPSTGSILTPSTTMVNTPSTGDTVLTTHQPARPMKEPQCPIPSSIASSQTPQTKYSASIQTRMIVYILQILMQSFALSITFRIPLTTFKEDQRMFRMRLLYSLGIQQMSIRRSSPWTRQFPGNVTPNQSDLCGAVRDAVTRRRGNVKSILMNPGRHGVGKDVLRLVHKSGRRIRGKCIQLIVKKRHGKRKYNK